MLVVGMKKINTYFSKHVTFNSLIHAIGGMGIGILIASPIVGPHPVRVGVTLLVIALIGHLYAYKT